MAKTNEQYAIALEVTLDFACETATPVVRCKQGDSNRYIKIYPLENGEKIITTTEEQTVIIDPTATEVYGGKVTFRVQRPDGAIYEYTYPSEEQGIFEWIVSRVEGKEYENVLDYVAFSFSEDMLAVEGRALCDVSFELATTGTVSTASFYLDIEPKPQAKASGGIDPSSFVNVKEISATDYAGITPNPHTLYIIIDGETVSLAYGSAQLISGNGYNETQTDTVTDSVEEVTE